MNDRSSALPPENQPPKKSTARQIATGFIVVVLAVLLGIGQPTVLIFDMLGLPLVSIVLAAIPKTRKLGLGMLLACGLGWLILLSICGGLFKR